MLKDHLKTLTPYGAASSKQGGGGGGTLRNELDDAVMWHHLTNSRVIEENPQGYINNEMFQCSFTRQNELFKLMLMSY